MSSSNPTNVLLGNYGNETIALMQWAQETKLSHVTLVWVETGLEASRWRARVMEGRAFAERCGFQGVCLKASPDFSALMKQRHGFPEPRQQWCASLLKGLTLLDWLDEWDPELKATIHLGKTRFSVREQATLSEYVTDSEYYEGRLLRHPLVHDTPAIFKARIEKAGFSYLPHRSFECEPCVNATPYDFAHMEKQDIERMASLEHSLGKTMFSKPMEEMVKKYEGTLKNEGYLEKFYRGCSTPFGCGL